MSDKRDKVFYDSIQGVRALGFFAIFLFHCKINGFELGWGGVDLFFVISGFLLTEKLFKYESGEINVGNMLKKRIIRLYPEYLLIVFLFTFIFIIVKKQIPNDFIWYITSTQNLLWIVTGYKSSIQGFTAHTWTLAIEIQLYISWLILLRVWPKKKYPLLFVILIVIAFLFRTVSVLYFHNIYLTSVFFLSHIDAYALGGLISCYNNHMKPKIVKFIINSSAYIGLACLTVIIIILAFVYNTTLIKGYHLLSNPENYLHNIFTANIYFFLSLVSLAVISFCINNKTNFVKQTLNIKFLKYTGKVSYTLYIFHWPILFVLKYYTSNKYVLVAAGLIVTFVSTHLFTSLMNSFIKQIKGNLHDTII